jgi:hypothetical protein
MPGVKGTKQWAGLRKEEENSSTETVEMRKNEVNIDEFDKGDRNLTV